jgi:hypothetical protein
MADKRPRCGQSDIWKWLGGIAAVVPLWVIQNGFLVCLCNIGQAKGTFVTIIDGLVIIRLLVGWAVGESPKVVGWYLLVLAALIPFTEMAAWYLLGH